MSGPALKQQDAHHAIHHAAYGEAQELLHVVKQSVEQGLPEVTAVIQLFLEHFQMRVINHADEEEKGFYQEICRDNSAMTSTIAALSRDHELMRQLWQEIQEEVRHGTQVAMIASRCEHLLWLSAMHSKTEEAWLFEKEEMADEAD